MFVAHNIPNMITAARIIFMPCLVWLLFHHQYERSLVLILCLGVSDALDGFLARWYGWKTTLGCYLDPLADKLMIAGVYITFAALGWVPWWFLILIISRDILLVFSVAYAFLMSSRSMIQPVMWSKVNTFLQIVLAIALIYEHMRPLNAQILNVLMTLVVCTTIASASHYLLGWWKRSGNTVQSQL